MLATRPFLLYSVIRGQHISNERKRRCFKALSKKCVDAANSSLDVLKVMSKDMVLSSLTTFDCNLILEVVMVFLLALGLKSDPSYKGNILLCMDLLGSMESIGWCKEATWELTNHLMDLGIIERGHDSAVMRGSESPYSTSDQDANMNAVTNVSACSESYDIPFEELFVDFDFCGTGSPRNLFQQITNVSRNGMGVTTQRNL